MALFQYKARNAQGTLVTGSLEAASVDAAATELLGQGMTPLDIRASERGDRAAAAITLPSWSFNADSLKDLKTLLTQRRITVDDKIIFARQMQSLTKAGIPLDRALGGLQGSARHPALQTLLKDLQNALESGQPLSTALAAHPKVFSPLFLSLVDVGENTGRLDLAFGQIGHYLQLEKNMRKKVKSAVRYPSFVLSTILVAIVVITYFVIPAFSDTFARLGADLPLETRILIAVSDFVVGWWPVLLACGIAGYLTFRGWLASPPGRLAWDRYKLRMPLVGGIFHKVSLARFSRTFSMVMGAGVPIVLGMGVVAGAVGNEHVRQRVLKMRDGISRGETLFNTATSAGLFSPLVLQMIAVGEESGSIDQLLEEVADFYDAEVEYELKRLGEVIEPILVMVVAAMTLVLALGVFLPIWDLSNAANT